MKMLEKITNNFKFNIGTLIFVDVMYGHQYLKNLTRLHTQKVPNSF